MFVTTQLRGKKTWFLPFDTGSEGPGEPGGAGNPAATVPGTLRVHREEGFILDLLRQ